jgi:hypothetical protein
VVASRIVQGVVVLFEGSPQTAWRVKRKARSVAKLAIQKYKNQTKTGQKMGTGELQSLAVFVIMRTSRITADTASTVPVSLTHAANHATIVAFVSE